MFRNIVAHSGLIVRVVYLIQFPKRTNEDHRKHCQEIGAIFQEEGAKTALDDAVSSKGVCYTELPYFDPTRFRVVDPMHNLFLGTGKHFRSLATTPHYCTDQGQHCDNRRCCEQICNPRRHWTAPKQFFSTFWGIHC